jgi:hypothetical protein
MQMTHFSEHTLSNCKTAKLLLIQKVSLPYLPELLQSLLPGRPDFFSAHAFPDLFPECGAGSKDIEV